MMTTIEDLKPQKGKEGVWGFAVRYIFPNGETNKSIGWRYFEESGEAVSPATKIGARWIPTNQGSDGFLAELARKVRELLVPQDEAAKFAEEVWSFYQQVKKQGPEKLLADLDQMETKNRSHYALQMIARAVIECR